MSQIISSEIKIEEDLIFNNFESSIEGEVIVTCRGQEYIVSKKIAELLDICLQMKNIGDISKELSVRWNIEIEDVHVLELANEFLKPFFQIKEERNENGRKTETSSISDNFWIYFPVVSGKIVFFLTGMFKIFFNPIIAFTALSCSLMILVYFIGDAMSFERAVRPDNFFIAYGIAILIVLAHEFGHATAYKLFTAKESGAIYFGIFFIIPAMFVKVNEAQKLPRRKKLIIDFAGIYFQMLITLPLFIMFYFGLLSEFLFILSLSVNVFLMFWNLNPIFRFDGYWILSDILNVPNLGSRSKKLLKYAMFKNFSTANDSSNYLFNSYKKSTRMILIIYGFFRYMVIAFFISIIFSTIPQIPERIVSNFSVITRSFQDAYSYGFNINNIVHIVYYSGKSLFIMIISIYVVKMTATAVKMVTKVLIRRKKCNL